MAVTVTVGTNSDEFLRVILADPDLLDNAFAEVVASWQAGQPPASSSTLVAAGRPPGRKPPRLETGDRPGRRRQPPRAMARPRVARSPPGAPTPSWRQTAPPP